ncbi:MAG TPA: hypothetical protein DDW90_06590 [Cyanobacteria bacterium UBA9971]|nr:hypothetical protein [Cyanobacteria bacterium UBA9971]
MDELHIEQDEFLKPFLITNLIITIIGLIPLLLIDFFFFVLINTFCPPSGSLFGVNAGCSHDHKVYIINTIIFILIPVPWIISTIFSIQGLKQKKLGKIKTIYTILSFVSILFAIPWFLLTIFH